MPGQKVKKLSKKELAKQEIQRLYDNLIKFADKSNTLVKFGVNAALSIQGHRVKIAGENTLVNLTYGPLGLMLATTPSYGVIGSAQTLGVAMLTVLGFKSLIWSDFGQPGGWNVGGRVIRPIEEGHECFTFEEWEELTRHAIAIPKDLICPGDWPKYCEAYPLDPWCKSK